MPCASWPRWACSRRWKQRAIENLESVFFNRYGQFIYREPRGRHAGYALPELGIHRGKLHRIMYRRRAGTAWVPRMSIPITDAWAWTRSESGAVHLSGCPTTRRCRRVADVVWPATA
jgi:hypothetical protein